MTTYSKSDMLYNDYSWTAYRGDDPHVSGEPDSTLLNRKEGYEVLYFINMYAKKHFFYSFVQCQKVERMIRNNVPSTYHSQKNIHDWISENWSRY